MEPTLRGSLPMSKASSQSALGRCLIFVIRGGGDVDAWANWVEEALRAQGNLTTNLSDADVILVVAGQSFLDGRDPGFHRLLKQAFEQKKPVVPVLVNDARMPSIQDRRADMRKFAYQQAVTITSNLAIPGTLARVIAAHCAPAARRRAAGYPIRQSTTSVAPQSLEPKGPSVFVCYRRDDSGYWADALARALASKVGGDRVFFDVGSEQPGRDYRKQIVEALARCTHFVVVIGPGFLEPDAKGIRRLYDAHDQVRSEIRSALTMRKPIHVVLTGDARLPARREVPADIAGLANASSIFRLKSESAADAVAEEIVAGRSRAAQAKGMPDVLGVLRREQKVLQKVAESVVAKLADFGWNVVSQRFDLGQCYTLGHSQYPRFRFEVQSREAEVALQEQIHSARRLGFRRWATRSVFSISPRTYSTVDMLQFPEGLLEAAMDPGRYLDRTGRFEWTKHKRRKLMGQHVFLGNVKSMAKPNLSAVEAHQQMRRRVSARGGLARLVPQEYVLDLPAGTLAQSAVFHPDGSRLAVVSDGGLHMVSTRDWRAGPSVQIGASCRSVDFSHQGHLAVGSDKGRVWIWDADGSPLETAITPYSLLRRALARWAGEEIAFTTVSWSDSGDVLAYCGSDAVWVYRIAARQLTRWAFPEHRALNSYYGAHFIRGRNELLVFGRFHRLWVVRLPVLEVRSTLGLKERPSRLDLIHDSDRAAEPVTSPAFTNIYSAEPSPRGDLAACAGSHGQVAVFDLSSMELVRTIAWHEPFRYGMPANVYHVSFSPDGRWLASVGADGELVVGNTRDWEPERAARVDGLLIGTSIAWSPDSTTMAVITSGRVGLWRM